MFLTYFRTRAVTVCRIVGTDADADADGLACYVSGGVGHSRNNGIKISNVSTPDGLFMQYFCIGVTRKNSNTDEG